MPAVIPLIQFGLPAAISAGATIAGSRAQSGAVRDASTISERYNQRSLDAAIEEQRYRRSFDEDERRYGREQDALDRAFKEDERGYQRGQRADYLSRLEPFHQPGVEATGRLSSLISNSPYGRMASSGIPAGGAEVTLRAPDGSIRSVPTAHADHYLNLGAVRV